MMGKGAFCKKACQWLLNNPTYYDLQYVVPVIPEPKWTDSIIEFCVKNKIKYLSDGDYKNLPSELIILLMIKELFAFEAYKGSDSPG